MSFDAEFTLLVLSGTSFADFKQKYTVRFSCLRFQEISPIELRGTISFLGGIGYSLYCVLGLVLGMESVLGFSLPILLSSSIPPQVVFFFFLLFIPETPKFLMIVR